MKYGKLFYDNKLNRMNVHWDDGSDGKGFHCGEVIFARIPALGTWDYYRIEHNGDWYFFEYGDIPVGTEICNTKALRCRHCDCTYDRACIGGCHWVEPDLCSACAGRN